MLGRLHLITDTRPGRDVLGVVGKALAAGFEVVQVRPEDALTDREAYALTCAVLAMCREAGALCLVNDRLHLALAAGADGGHVGADDLPVADARRILGPRAILGATARDPGTARRAVADGASYLGVGPAYVTDTKFGLPDAIGPAGVRAVAEAVDVPVIAIGGVTAVRAAELFAAGAHGVAVVGAVSNAADPGAAAAEFSTAAHRSAAVRRSTATHASAALRETAAVQDSAKENGSAEGNGSAEENGSADRNGSAAVQDSAEANGSTKDTDSAEGNGSAEERGSVEEKGGVA